MCPRSAGGYCRACSCACGLVAASACQTQDEPAAAPVRRSRTLRSAPCKVTSAAEPLKNEIPPAELEAVMAAHFKGLGLMEQYEYGKAAEAFREVASGLRDGFPARSTWRSPS